MLNKDHKSVRVQIALALALALIAGVYRSTQAAATLLVPDNYPTIQAAINAASPGDTIMVRTGTYSESLTLNKSVILTAETFDSSDPTHNTTIIDSGASNSVSTINIPAAVSPMPTIRGFVIRNGSDGIRAWSEFIAEYNYFLQSGDLIDYSKGSGGINRHNIYFKSTDDSIDLDDMNRSLLIEDNRMMYSGDDGIEMRLQDSSAPVQLIEITIRNNEIIGSDEDGIQFIDYGQALDTNRRIVITGNLIANSRFAGIGLMPNANTKENYFGADILEAIRAYGNTLYGNDYGISGGDNLVAFNNIIANSTTKGIWKVQGAAGSNSVVAYSLFYNNGTDADQSSLGAGNLFGQNPLFSALPSPGVDGLWGTVDDDFSGLSLQAGSPAIDAGVTQYITNSGEPVPPAPITGFSGTAPDLGWKEFNPLQPSTPTETSTSTATSTFTPTATQTPTPTPTFISTNNVVVDIITRADLNPSSSTSVDFIVTFSDPVTGVDSSDFALTTTGVTGASITDVSGSGSIYTVTVNTGSGSGTIRLDVTDDDTIKDAALNPLGGVGAGNGNFTSGEIYTVNKLPASATFADVPLTYWAWQFIERLYAAGITGGCATTPSLIYCPDNTVTRAQMAVFLMKGMHGSGFTPPPVGTSTGFIDVATDYWAAAWIKQLAAEGITGGCGAGNYCPDATVTRAQMAIFLLKAKHGSSYSPPAATGVFTDVPVGYWADKWIEQLASEGITDGCGAGIYCPDSSVTRVQMAVFLVKTFNLP